VDQLELKRREEALGNGVVPAVAPAAHTADDPVLLQHPLVLAAGVLAPAIRMMQQARQRASAGAPALRRSPRATPGACGTTAVPGRRPFLRGDEREPHACSFAKKAIIAGAASMLTAAYYMLRDGVDYRDLGTDRFERRDKAKLANLLGARLHDLGFSVELRAA
jgi:hypothetical protein